MRDQSWIELSKKGGAATFGKLGVEHYKKMGKKSAIARRKKGKAYWKWLAKKGVEGRMKKRKLLAARRDPVKRLADIISGKTVL